ncbi:MAG: excinuclease ABC subunit UvrC [Salinivirgaceae bacterium]|nr:excinuclease ABC subunit UvrC [Salinivirgaceae bacterium]
MPLKLETEEQHIARLKELVAVLPESPGVYQYLDKNGTIIYVGKAKRLKRRVSSYFNKYQERAKIRVLVRNINDIKHIVVDTEQDALLLENNLIKKYQPRYNSLLKDDKTYPWICIKNEPFPRIFSTRKFVRDGSTYFGPYTSGFAMKTLLELIRQLYPIRTCALNLSREAVEKGKYKICLEHHIGNCLGPCEGRQTEEDYAEAVSNIKEILKGNSNAVIELLKTKMNALSKDYKFEEAQQIKNKIDKLSEFQSKSTIVSPTIHNVDVFSIIDDDDCAYINFMKVVNGAIVQVHTFEMQKHIEEDKESTLLSVIQEARERYLSTSHEIIVPFDLDFELDNITFTIPQRGDKKKLLELSQRNALTYKHEKLKQQLNRNPEKRTERIMETMKKDLRLKECPVLIEGFDNSNIQGTNPVASCVVFRNGKPSKCDYRHFNIKTVVGANDFASMEEIIYRRYSRQLEEGNELPQLILIDGGKGQLGAAVNSLTKLGLMGKISVIGIAKRLEELYYPGDPVPLYLDKNSETLKVLQNVRNESHRFGITFHRDKRSKAFLVSELDNIKGIGDKTKEALFNELKTIDAIRTAPIEMLEKIVGHAKAMVVANYFRQGRLEL